jgi:uncharacterized protein with beta-barrel porin domain
MSSKVRGFAATRSALLSVRFLVPALLAPLAMTNSATAASVNKCTTAPGVPADPSGGTSNLTITCTGDTVNAGGGTIGFGTGFDSGNTYNINPSASITGDSIGLDLGNGTVNMGVGAVVRGGTGTDSVGIQVVHQGGLTLTNAGTVSGGAVGISATADSQVTALTNQSTGVIQATGANLSSPGTVPKATFSNNAINILANDGAIESSVNNGIAIDGQTVTINSNNGTIRAGMIGIQGKAVTVTANSGNIFATSTGGTAIKGDSVTVGGNAGGNIFGNAFGIDARISATITNGHDGSISANSTTGVAIGSSDATPANTITIDNAGAIRSNGDAIKGQTVTINSNTGGGLIIADGNGTAVSASGTATVNNAANIQSVGATAIFADTANVTNLAGGTIQGAGNGIFATTMVVNNAGTIQGANGAIFVPGGGQATITNTSTGIIQGSPGILSQGNLTLTNAGSVTATSTGISLNGGSGSITNLAGGQISGGFLGIDNSTNNLTIANAGTISGATAIKSENGVITITNFGTIKSTAGATGTAIQLSGDGDTLNVKKGSQIVGQIDFQDGHDVVNVDSTASQIPPRGISTLSRATSAVVDALKQQFVNAENVIVNIIGGNSTGTGQPTVTVNGLTASLDPTALSQQDRALMDFTGGMSSMVQGRLSGGGNVQSASYALEGAHAEMYTKAPASAWKPSVNVWSSVFGAVRSQSGTDTTLNSTSSAFGGAIGIDRRIHPNWLVGVFAGGGNGTINVSLSSQKVDTDYVSAGAYSRFEWGPQFVDTTLQVGGMNNRSSRLVQNNVTSGLDHATASYNGWFVSPEIAYGYHIHLGGGTMVTPILRARYVAGFFDGFNEAGSAQTLSIGSRTLQDFEERGEVEFSKMTNFFGADQPFRLFFHGGAIAWQRTGDATVNAVLIGQSLSFVTPGKSNAVGSVAGVGFDHQIRPNVALFGSVEGTFMSDESRLVTAKGGLRVGF